MKKRKNISQDAKKLRQKAEEELKKQQAKTSSSSSENELQKLIHELEVHQIELEMQNEELIIAKEQAEQAEEKYAELYDYAPSGYLTLSKKGEITELNFAAARLLGKNRSQLIKRNFAFFLSEDSRSDFHLFFQNIFAGKGKQSCELTLIPGGNSASATTDNLIHINVDGILNRDNELCHLTMIDITEKIKRNQELIKAKEKAEETDRLKSIFLANMSHEIRTPMNGILGFAELLKNPDISYDQKQHYTNIIKQSGTRLLNIIDNLIDVSKIEAGLMKLEMTQTNINEQIEYIYSFFKPEVEAKGMELSFSNTLPSKEAIINTDREKVYAILTNLVKNAIKYSREGTIVLGYTKKDKTLEFYVKDTGIGIPEERQNEIFERFIQADIKDKKARQGAGLGLTIAKAYVEMLGGKIWVESQEGIGSTFYFTLPYLVESESQNTDTQAIPGENKLQQTKNLKILIAEDDITSEMLLSEYVNEFAEEIIEAKTGHETIEICRNNPDIDLILMDIQMPDLNGYEATKRIRQFNQDVVIIAQTAFVLSGDKEAAIEAGCNDYIAKPIDKAELKELIQMYFQPISE
ncbi:MAG: ATP-binding protein [Bacteroidales bacterium]